MFTKMEAATRIAIILMRIDLEKEIFRFLGHKRISKKVTAVNIKDMIKTRINFVFISEIVKGLEFII